MPADSLAVFSQHWNMWKKLVFYISQLVASSADWPVTPHRDPNAHKGSVPIELPAFPERERKGREALTMGDLCSATQGKRYRVFSEGSHTDTDVDTHTHSRSQVRRLPGKWTRSVSEITDQKPSGTTPRPRPLPKPTWRLGHIYIQICSFCITSGANYGIQMWRLRQCWRARSDGQL